MNALLMAAWLTLPLAPLNPIEEDTLASMNAHFSVAATIPNGIVSAGPELSAKCELLVVHPFMVRGGIDFKYCHTVSELFPKGTLLSLPLSLDAIYYRGTNHLTGYIGFGAIYAINSFSPKSSTIDSLMQYRSVTDVDMRHEFGYRLTLGLRYHKAYSLEISISEIYPEFILRGIGPNGESTRSLLTTRVGGFRLSFGYLFAIKEL
jgi:hypothetical protein